MRMLLFRSPRCPWQATFVIAVLASLVMASPAVADPVSVDDLLRLLESGLDEETILVFTAAHGLELHPDVDAVLLLAEAGASPNLLQALVRLGSPDLNPGVAGWGPADTTTEAALTPRADRPDAVPQRTFVTGNVLYRSRPLLLGGSIGHRRVQSGGLSHLTLSSRSFGHSRGGLVIGHVRRSGAHAGFGGGHGGAGGGHGGFGGGHGGH